MADLSAYPELFYLLNKDRQQTHAFLARGGEELNPLLGRHPSAGMVNRAVAASALTPVIADVAVHNKKLPPWVARLLKDSMIYSERLVTNRNEDVAKNPRLKNALPIGLAYSGTADWDRALSRWFGRIMSKD